MAVQARGDFFGRQGSILNDQNFQPVIMAVQEVSAGRLCGRKMENFREERFTSIPYDLRKGLSSALERGSRQLTRTALIKEQRPVCNCVGASSNVAQEPCHESPRQGFVRGSRELRIGSTIAILKNRQQQGISMDSYAFVDILKG